MQGWYEMTLTRTASLLESPVESGRAGGVNWTNWTMGRLAANCLLQPDSDGGKMWTHRKTDPASVGSTHRTLTETTGLTAVRLRAILAYALPLVNIFTGVF